MDSLFLAKQNCGKLLLYLAMQNEMLWSNFFLRAIEWHLHPMKGNSGNKCAAHRWRAMLIIARVTDVHVGSQLFLVFTRFFGPFAVLVGSDPTGCLALLFAHHILFT